MEPLKLGKYRHYKGGLYQVLGLALNTETREKLVLYKALYDCPDLAQEYGTRPFFVRPYALFMGSVSTETGSTPRFERLEE